jgi:hypothetical protein
MARRTGNDSAGVPYETVEKHSAPPSTTEQRYVSQLLQWASRQPELAPSVADTYSSVQEPPPGGQEHVSPLQEIPTSRKREKFALLRDTQAMNY